MLRFCTVLIPSIRGGHYHVRVEAESSLQAASLALAEHEELMRQGKLKQPNRITPETVLEVVPQGDSNGVSFSAADPQHQRFRHTVAQVKTSRL